MQFCCLVDREGNRHKNAARMTRESQAPLRPSRLPRELRNATLELAFGYAPEMRSSPRSQPKQEGHQKLV